MAELKLTYGKDSNGRLVHVDDVPSGLACDCTCPECGALLIARKGKKNQHHFAHANGADCSGARMTALHMLAQQIIQEDKKIRKPHFKEYCEDVTKIIEFSSVELEVHFKTQEVNRRPDCVGIILKGDKRIEVWIEIKVTHEVDEEKKKDIERLGAICMEVDLSDMLAEDYSKELITKRLVDSYKNRKWINYPQLFKKNEIAKLKKEEVERIKREKEKEEEQRRQNELARERARLQEIVNSWLQLGMKEDANKIIQLIKNDPYNKQELPFTIYELLIPYNDFVSWVKRSPKKLEGLELFYIIANFYTRQIGRLEIKDIDNELKKYRFKDSIDEIDQIVLEELVSLRVICRLRRIYDRYIDFCLDNIKEWYKKYSTNADFRNLCLKILSIEYGHIMGSKSTNFRELTEEIYTYSPDILPMYLKALEYRHQKKWPRKNIPSLDDDMIVKCKNYVSSHSIEENKDCKGLLNCAFEYIFNGDVYIPNTNLAEEEQKDEDISFNGQMSFEEIVEGFAKMGEELNKQQY